MHFSPFCDCILFRFIGIPERIGIAVLMSDSVANFVLVSGQNVKQLSLRFFKLLPLANENKTRRPVIPVLSSLTQYNGQCLTSNSHCSS